MRSVSAIVVGASRRWECRTIRVCFVGLPAWKEIACQYGGAQMKVAERGMLGKVHTGKVDDRTGELVEHVDSPRRHEASG